MVLFYLYKRKKSVLQRQQNQEYNKVDLGVPLLWVVEVKWAISEEDCVAVRGVISLSEIFHIS